MNPKLIQENTNVLKAEYNRTLTSIAQLQEQIKDSNRVLVSQREEIEYLDSLIEEKKSYYRGLEDELRNEYHEDEVLLQKEIVNLTIDIQNKKKELDSLCLNIKNKENEIYSLSKDIIIKEGIIDEQNDELNQLDIQIDKKIQRHKEAQVSLNEIIKEKNNLEDYIAESRTIIHALEEDISFKKNVRKGVLYKIENEQEILRSLSSQIEHYKLLVADITILENRKQFLKEEIRDSYNKTVLSHRK